MISSALALLARVAELLGIRARRRERADAEKTGANKQRLETSEEALRARDEQLDKMVNRRPGDARRRLDDGSF